LRDLSRERRASIDPVRLGPSSPPVHLQTGRIEDMVVNAMRLQYAMQPEAVISGSGTPTRHPEPMTAIEALISAMKRAHKVHSEWWRKFFQPITAEVMFVAMAGLTELEVEQVLRQSKAKPPLQLLDLACGVGRHSLSFAKRGFKVTGLDYSKAFLRDAQQAARKTGQKIRFIHGNMKDLKPHFAANQFDLVVSLYNSFGYFSSRRDDLAMIKSVHRVLRPGGAFVLNTLNGRSVAKRLKTPISLGREPVPNVFMIDASQYDSRNKRTISKWTIVDTRRARVRLFRKSFKQNIYSPAELRKLLIAAGFRIEKTWGTLLGGRFNPSQSWHQTVLARKRPSRRAH
jgi:ubiquinone/menaquinone biosynthesis C-methylase UbiE